MAKYFRIPFCATGTKTAVPDAHQTDGTVNYTDGYGPQYGLDKAVDPSALNIERDKMNELFYDITNALKTIQQQAYPDFITSSDNGGTPYSYSRGNTVRYNNGTTTETYVSLINGNTDLPTVTSSWADIRRIPQSNRDVLTGPATLSNADGNGRITIALTSPAPLVFNLPSVSSIIPFLPFKIKCNGAVDGTNTVTLTPQAGQTFENASSYVFDLPYAALTIYTDGVQWLAEG